MSKRRSKKTFIAVSDVKNLTKTVALDPVRPRPTKIIRWHDRNAEPQEIYLYSENFPNPPFKRVSSCTRFSFIAISRFGNPKSYWYNQYASLMPFVESVSGAINLYANMTKSSYKHVLKKVMNCTIFFDWMLRENDPRQFLSLSDVSENDLRSFRNYLYYEYRKEHLSNGGNNQAVWQTSIPNLISYFLKHPSDHLIHPKLKEATFPKYSNPSHECSTIDPYNDMEMFIIIAATDKYCKNYIHNWNVMREIEAMKISTSANLNDIAWAIVNIERQSSQTITFPYEILKDKFKITKQQFYARYSEANIEEMAKRGTCPYARYYEETLHSLSDHSRLIFARSCIRRYLARLIDFRFTTLANTEMPDWRRLFEIAIPLVNRFSGQDRSKMQAYWEAAGLRDLAKLTSYELVSLFVPTTYSIIPFHLFVMATAGLNLEVVNSIDRNKTYSDLDPENILYRSVKKRTGSFNYRFEDIVVNRDEDNGIHQRIEFIKKITEPFLRWASSAKSKESLWHGLNVRPKGTAEFVSFAEGDKGYRNYRSANRAFSLNCNLQTINQLAGVNELVFSPMSSINAKRLRKTNVFKDMAEEIPPHIIQAALADHSLETVFKWYIDNSIQRRVNFNAIAACQGILMKEIGMFSRLTTYNGEIVYDTPLADAKDISNNLINACGNPSYFYSEGHACEYKCNVPTFDICFGCKNSRVFREHLPAICFRIIQYDEKKLKMPSKDWEATYNLYRRRAIDCLGKYAKRGDLYMQHVDNSWVIARTEGGVYLPQLI